MAPVPADRADSSTPKRIPRNKIHGRSDFREWVNWNSGPGEYSPARSFRRLVETISSPLAARGIEVPSYHRDSAANAAGYFPMELRIIDAIGPFFRDYRKRRVNWSKIPFSHLATEGPERPVQWQRIAADLDHLCRQVAALGYNAVTLDDVAHLVDHPWFEPEVRARVRVFREEFRQLFSLVRGHGLSLFVTCDCMATTPWIDERLDGSEADATTWFVRQLETFLEEFHEVAGVILRIGECDGNDVRDPLRSRILIKSSRQANRLLRALLPVFESHDRRLIFRTWTVGAHPIGDLIWNPARLAEVLHGIRSPALVLSMKPGESDFFRHLPLNPLFHATSLPKIVELQARREYEGAGEYPSFIGWQCERLLRELQGAQNLVGFSVWCQTGGWHRFRRLAFLDSSSRWIELNAAIAPLVLHQRLAVEDAIRSLAGPNRAEAAVELLRLADESIRHLLYIRGAAETPAYFRRVRIPPLLHVYWDSIFINRAMRDIVRSLVPDAEAALGEGERAYENFPRMISLANELDWNPEDVRFMQHTFRLIVLARRYFFLPENPELLERIATAKSGYKKRWPAGLRPRYRVKTAPVALPLRTATLRLLFRVLLRRARGYRPLADHLLTLRMLPWGYQWFHRHYPRALPKFIRKSAMGVQSLFR